MAPPSASSAATAAALAGNQLLAYRPAGQTWGSKQKAPPAGWAGELESLDGVRTAERSQLAVGGVCQLQALSCNYSQWWTLDYISANVMP